MIFFRIFLLRFGIWIALPILLIALLIGPRRFADLVRRGWNWLFARRLEPEVLLAQVVTEQKQHIKTVREALAKAEDADAELVKTLEASRTTVAALEREARKLVDAGDDLGAKGALYKLNLENAAIKSFEEQLGRQHGLIADSRKRLYTLELQLRQFEVGRSILLSQLAQAKSLEQQYEIASQFDPFNAVSNWEQAENLVQEKSLTAEVKQRVLEETSEQTVPQTVDVDAALLDAQLKELRQKRLAEPHVVEEATDSRGESDRKIQNNGSASEASDDAGSDAVHFVRTTRDDAERSS